MDILTITADIKNISQFRDINSLEKLEKIKDLQVCHRGGVVKKTVNIGLHAKSDSGGLEGQTGIVYQAIFTRQRLSYNVQLKSNKLNK